MPGGCGSLAATILPCEGEARCTAAADAERIAVNAWIRDGEVFDGVLDFDAVVRDPGRPARMLPAYDSGDHLHPGDTGLAALADSVDLRLLRPYGACVGQVGGPRVCDLIRTTALDVQVHDDRRVVGGALALALLAVHVRVA